MKLKELQQLFTKKVCPVVQVLNGYETDRDIDVLDYWDTLQEKLGEFEVKDIFNVIHDNTDAYNKRFVDVHLELCDGTGREWDTILDEWIKEDENNEM